MARALFKGIKPTPISSAELNRLLEKATPVLKDTREILPVIERAKWSEQAVVPAPIDPLAADFHHPIVDVDFVRVGTGVLKDMVPFWKQYYSPSFSKEQLAVVEEAFIRTDEVFFARGERGQVYAASNEWDYAARFANELTIIAEERGLSFSAQQYRQLLGGSGMKDWSFLRVFQLLSLEAYVLANGHAFPRTSFSVNGQVLRARQLTPEQIHERQLGSSINNALRSEAHNPADPVMSRMDFLKNATRRHEHPKSPQEVLDELEDWISTHKTFPKNSFYREGRLLPRSELTQEQRYQQKLFGNVRRVIGMSSGGDDPIANRLLALKKEYGAFVTMDAPQIWLERLEIWLKANPGLFPQSTFYKKGRAIEATALTPAQRYQRTLIQEVNYHLRTGNPEDPAIQKLRALKQTYTRGQ